MKIAITGGSGLVGYGVVLRLMASGHSVTTLGRKPLTGVPYIPWDLSGEAPDLTHFDRLVHMAFSHVPGKYRGGEGDDPEAFLETNLIGTLRLFEAAHRTGLHSVFLSSRAVYGAYLPGTRLTEALPPRPDTLYGELKHECETALGQQGVSLRSTGVYGPPPPGRRHKWADLFDAFAQGHALPARIGTEVHVEDLAAAVELALNPALAGRVFNVSDILLDRRTLLSTYRDLTGRRGILPDTGDPGTVSQMETGNLRALGWSPRGFEGFAKALKALVDPPPAPGAILS